MEKVIITAAICGAEVTKEHNPRVPYTINELINEAKGAYEAGASVIHLHVRQDDGTPTQSADRYREAMKAIREACPDVIIQPSTGGAVGMSNRERLQPIALKPEMATLDCGTLNFGGDDIFINTENTIIEFAEAMKEAGVKPELEVFDQSMIRMAMRLMNKGYIPMPMHFNFVMGVNGGIGAEIRDFSFLADSLPQGATYTATGLGRHQFSVVAMAVIHGGHIRVGFEDNIYLSRGVLAKSNRELVAKAVRIAEDLGREIATPGDARRILGLRTQDIKGDGYEKRQ